MSKHKQMIAVIGMGTFGIETAKALMKSGIPVCAIDDDEDIIESIKEQVTTAIVLDTTQEQGLREAEIDSMDAVVVAIGSGRIENSILTTALLKQLGVKTIIARSTSDLHERILRKVGADMIVNPERDMGARLARRIAQPALLDLIVLPNNACIAKVPVPEPFVEHTLSELGVRRNYNLTVMGIERPVQPAAGASAPNAKAPEENDMNFSTQDLGKDFRIIMNVDPVHEKMRAGDYLLVMGKEENVKQLTDL